VFADEPTGNLDSATSGEILELVRDSVQSYGQTTVMVTHDARAAAIADRILFPAAAPSVREPGRPPTRRESLKAMTQTQAGGGRWTRSQPGDGVRSQRAVEPKAPDDPHRDGDRPGGRDDERNLRAHGFDQERVLRDLHAELQRHRRGDQREVGIHPLEPAADE